MADFLLELLSEEIPARMQAGARNELARLFAEHTRGAGLGTGAIDVHSTPRRLVLIAREVAEATEASREETKGPRTSAPVQAFEGFLRKTGLTRDQLEERDGVYFATVERPGRRAAEILADTVARIAADFSWPKSMRWGSGSLRWVRPLHGIVAMLGEEIVPVEVDGIASSATTVGHRFHHPGAITVGGASDYVEKLRACHVIVDQEERERIIREGAEAAAKKAGLSLLHDEGLVVENAGLTEWPVPLLGEFDEDFLDVPREVIVLTMRTNQKYFACTASDGGLAPAFVCVANIAANDGGAAIVEGNRRVLAARLADARFFWEQDLKVPLEEQAKKLDGIVFHEKLGTVAEKVDRVAKLARWLVESGVIPLPAGEGDSPKASGVRATDHPHPSAAGAAPSLSQGRGALADQAERAARLAKADLVTGMVGEFPELQGVIGGYLAKAQGEPEAVAEAIRDHYKPVGQGDEVPTAPVTIAVAVADKLDTLVSFFAIGQKPTGSKDPFALRRAALGIIRLILQSGVRLSLMDIVREARHALVTSLARSFDIVSISDDTAWNEPAPVSPATPSQWDPGTVFAVPREAAPETFVTQNDTAYPAYSRNYLEETTLFRVRVDSLVDVVGGTLMYFTDRIEEAERASGVRIDLIRSVVPRDFGAFDLWSIVLDRAPRTEGAGVHRFRKPNWRLSDDPVAILARVRALQQFIETSEGADLLTAYKRAANILKKENWTGPQVMSSPEEQGIPQTGEEDPLVLVEEPGLKEAVAEMASGQAGADLPEEKALVAALDTAEPKASAAIAREDFTAAMAALASLRAPIDDFFDHVTVNDPDASKRERRLNLLMRFRDAVNDVADFSRIEG